MNIDDIDFKFQLCKKKQIEKEDSVYIYGILI